MLAYNDYPTISDISHLLEGGTEQYDKLMSNLFYLPQPRSEKEEKVISMLIETLPVYLANFKVYTSYYAKYKTVKNMGITPIITSVGYPKFLGAGKEWYKPLAPTREMLKMKESEYKIEYAKILSKLNPRRVLGELWELAGRKPFAICCYEKPGEFCHRHLVADWLKKVGFSIEEFNFESGKQINLFA